MDNAATTAIRVVRYGELRPCRTAFIDAHTPGSNRKENFTIIGGGVSESTEQFVHIRETPGFNIGAAGQPPNCRNSLHAHRTAEVFLVQSGRWRFYWGRNGDAGEAILEEGDVFDIPTGIFRGFENIGTDYGLIFAVLGGDDAGGGVVWAPQVIAEARRHGLQLSASGRLYDSKRGERLPEGEAEMAPMNEAEVAAFPELPVEAVIPRFVARRLDIQALGAQRPVTVIGSTSAMITDRPGFTMEYAGRGALPATPVTSASPDVLIVHRGHWSLAASSGDMLLAPGDVALVPAGEPYAASATMAGEAGLYRIRRTADAPGPTWRMPAA